MEKKGKEKGKKGGGREKGGATHLFGQKTRWHGSLICASSRENRKRERKEKGGGGGFVFVVFVSKGNVQPRLVPCAAANRGVGTGEGKRRRGPHSGIAHGGPCRH